MTHTTPSPMIRRLAGLSALLVFTLAGAAMAGHHSGGDAKSEKDTVETPAAGGDFRTNVKLRS